MFHQSIVAVFCGTRPPKLHSTRPPKLHGARSSVVIDGLQSLLPTVLINMIVDYQTNYCTEHGSHISSFCLHRDCLNKRIVHPPPYYSYVLNPARTFTCHLCSNCKGSRIEVTDKEDKEYVAEVNARVYDQLGAKNKEYYLNTRCIDCEGRTNTLYGGKGGSHPTPNKVVEINICCYDKRWYITFFSF